jgi:ATP-binding cassette, subfamily B, bacterial
VIETLPRGALRRHIVALLRPHRGRLALAAVAVVLSTGVTISGPLLIAYGIDQGIRESDRDALRRVVLIFLALALAKPGLERVQIMLGAQVAERFLGALRVAAFERLQRLPLAFFETERAGVLVSRLTADVQSLTLFVRQVFVEVAAAVLLLVATAIALVVLSPALAAVCLVSVPLLTFATAYFHRHSRPAYSAIRDRVAETMSALQEGLTGMRVVQSFNREQAVFDRYLRPSWALVAAWRRAAFVNVRFFPSIVLGQIVTTIAVLLAGGVLYDRDVVTVGVIAAFILYALSLFDPIAVLGEWLDELQSGRAALTKIIALLEAPVTVDEKPDGVDLPAQGALEADDVVFAYQPGMPVLHGIDLRIEPGEHLALVGATGAGKSSLAKLLTRLYDPTEGAVRVAGIDLRDARLESLRRAIALVPQEGHLFSGTIVDNIRLARPEASEADVASALDHIGARERFEALPDGLRTEVQTRGVRLSAGERQLVGLARVALANPQVMVLDEATSSLDPGTEAVVERALGVLTRGRTVVTIAHRLTTAERADRIAVLAAGRLVELGSHEELLAQGGIYTGMWRAWETGAPGEQEMLPASG